MHFDKNGHFELDGIGKLLRNKNENHQNLLCLYMFWSLLLIIRFFFLWLGFHEYIFYLYFLVNTAQTKWVSLREKKLSKKVATGTSLAVQGVRLLSQCKGHGSIPGLGTRIPRVAWHSQNIKKVNKRLLPILSTLYSWALPPHPIVHLWDHVDI